MKRNANNFDNSVIKLIFIILSISTTGPPRMEHTYQCNVNINTNRFLIVPRQMVFKSLVDSRHYHSSGDLERHEEPEEKGNV